MRAVLTCWVVICGLVFSSGCYVTRTASDGFYFSGADLESDGTGKVICRVFIGARDHLGPGRSVRCGVGAEVREVVFRRSFGVEPIAYPNASRYSEVTLPYVDGGVYFVEVAGRRVYEPSDRIVSERYAGTLPDPIVLTGFRRENGQLLAVLENEEGVSSEASGGAS